MRLVEPADQVRRRVRDLVAAPRPVEHDGDLRAKLLEAGFPNLWVPKIIIKVAAIPVLGTGKTDLKGCRNLALEHAATQSVE